MPLFLSISLCIFCFLQKSKRAKCLAITLSTHTELQAHETSNSGIRQYQELPSCMRDTALKAPVLASCSVLHAAVSKPRPLASLGLPTASAPAFMKNTFITSLCKKARHTKSDIEDGRVSGMVDLQVNVLLNLVSFQVRLSFFFRNRFPFLPHDGTHLSKRCIRMLFGDLQRKISEKISWLERFQVDCSDPDRSQSIYARTSS